jgi:uncharacterized repeat protein (TIGR03803 family)
VRNLLATMLVSTLAMILSTVSPGICSFYEHILWSLETSNGSNGIFPQSSVLLDQAGNIFGTAWEGGAYDSSGAVFEISATGNKSVIWNFNGQNGAAPEGGLITDESGALYGTTSGGGAFAGGTVFRLMPPAAPGGEWTESVLWSFGNGDDGKGPIGSLIADANGNLFGTTEFGGGSHNNGVVYELSPPPSADGNWSESVLWTFGNPRDGALPHAGLVMDQNGDLYGTTQLGGPSYFGTVFELTAPSSQGGSWSESIIWDFGDVNISGYSPNGNYPVGPLLMDRQGNLYGTTQAGGPGIGKPPLFAGTVFRLSPPSSGGETWNPSVLWKFGAGGGGAGPMGNLVMDANGNLYGTTVGVSGTKATPAGGILFELSPGPGDNALWSETTLWVFGRYLDGSGPGGGLTIDKMGNLYGTTVLGGLTARSTEGSGTVFEVSNVSAPSRATLEISPKTSQIRATIGSATPGKTIVTLRNVTSYKAVVSITGINTETTAFTASQNCVGSLAPGKSCKVTVTFTPSEPGRFADILNVISNAKIGALQKTQLIGIEKSVK